MSLGKKTNIQIYALGKYLASFVHSIIVPTVPGLELNLSHEIKWFQANNMNMDNCIEIESV